MELIAAGGKIGAGETLKAQRSAIGAAADGLSDRFNAISPESVGGGVNQMHMGLDLFPHVVVGGANVNRNSADSVFCIEKIRGDPHQFFLLVELF